MDIHSYVDMCTVGAKEENPFSLLEISSGAHNMLFLIVLVREGTMDYAQYVSSVFLGPLGKKADLCAFNFYFLKIENKERRIL